MLVGAVRPAGWHPQPPRHAAPGASRWRLPAWPVSAVLPLARRARLRALIDGKAIAAEVRREVQERVVKLESA